MAYKEINVKERAEEGFTIKEKEFFKDLREKVCRDDDDRSTWKNKLITAANQRLGIKRVTNYPYENAPDIPLPETDKLIKKQIPNLVLSAWSTKKMCSVRVEEGNKETPQNKQQAQLSEDAMNMVLREKMDWFKKLELAADYAKEKGHCIFKIVEDFKTRRVHKVIDLDEYDDEIVKQLKAATNSQLKLFLQDRYGLDPEDDTDKETLDDIVDQFRKGEDVIEFDVYEVSSLPNIEVPLPNSVIVPAYTTDLEFAERLTHEYFLTRHEMEERFKDETFLKKELDDIGHESGDDDIVTLHKDQTEGVVQSTATEDLYRIHEAYCWYKPEGADCYERWIFTYMPDVGDDEDSLLRKIPFPFEFEGWNFERYDNERKDPRHYNSRGVPEQIRALQEVMERSINNMLIRDEYNNNPVYEVLDTSEILQRDRSFAPGELVPVSALGTEIKRTDERQIPDVSSMNIIQMIKAFAEEYQASSDQLFRNSTNSGGGKTLGEIEKGMQANSGALNLEIVRFNEVLSKVYTKVFKIMQERLGDSMWIGGQEITKEVFMFPATVKSNGSLEVSDMNMATQKAWMRLQAAMQMQQFQVADIEDLYNSYKDWLEKDGVKDPEFYSTHPAKVMQGKLQQMMMQLQQGAQQLEALNKELEGGQKELAKTKKTFSEEKQNFEGEMEAIAKGAHDKPKGKPTE